MWYRCILTAALFNGLAGFSGRIVQGWGLNRDYRLQYLAVWFGGGALVALALLIRGRVWPRREELALGVAMGTFSLLGEILLLRAMLVLPGSVVYSGIIAGEIVAVNAIGRLVFGERLGRYGIAGMVAGTAAVVLLAMG